MCEREGGKERKNKVQLDQSKELEKERNKQTITTWSKQGREWDGNQETSNGERQRDKQTNKREEWAEIRRRHKFIFTLCICPGTSSPLSHHIAYVYTSTFLK